MRTSVSTISMSVAARRANASAAEVAKVGSNPVNVSHWPMDRATISSSSTTRTVEASAIVLRRLPFRERNARDEDGAAALVRRAGEGAAVLLHRRLADGQPQPQAVAFRLRGEERLE